MTCNTLILQDVPATKGIDWDTWFYKPGALTPLGTRLPTALKAQVHMNCSMLLHACMHVRNAALLLQACHL
jgi:hypothetical protein